MYSDYAGPIGVRARMPRSRQNGGIPPMQPVVAREYVMMSMTYEGTLR